AKAIMSQRPARDLFRKQLPAILERLEFKCISAGIKQKHGSLFARFPREANVGLDHEIDVASTQAFGQGFPFIPLKDDAEMRYRDIVPIHRICMSVCLCFGFWMLVDHELMSVEVKVDPLGRGPAFGQPKNVCIKPSGGSQIMYRDGQVKWGQCHDYNPFSVYYSSVGHFVAARTARKMI